MEGEGNFNSQNVSSQDEHVSCTGFLEEYLGGAFRAPTADLRELPIVGVRVVHHREALLEEVHVLRHLATPQKILIAFNGTLLE